MKNAFFFALLFLPVLAFSQTEKGVQPLSNPQFPIPNSLRKESFGQTRAVVVGISNYQDNGIPDLQFAHRDAEEFAAWLQSEAGGKVPADNVQLLTNEKATRAQFDAALGWLIDESKEGDEAIIYFSGHGDVETKTKFNRGFLLCHDSPPTNYAAGAYPLTFLQDVISTLSEGKVKTIVVADACRSGKLAGSSVGGSQATAANLAKQFSNEIKILSCQPNEYSIEGLQWGGGRGAFSYNLVDGLFGLADNNHDGTVNLFEIGRYLQDKVTAEVAPVSQIPMIFGNMTERISTVNEPALAAFIAEKAAKKSGFSTIDVRGLEDETLARVDSVTRKMYRDFKSALAAKNFFDTSGADTIYRQLENVAALKPLHPAMRRNFAAALQDDVQQALNALLADDPYELSNWNFRPDKYAEFPNYLKRAIELLGKEHYTYSLLFAQQRYFEAYLLLKNDGEKAMETAAQDTARAKAKTMLLEAANLAPDAAYIFHAIGNLYFYNNPIASDSLLKYCTTAIELSPNWLLPYLQIVHEYRASAGDFEVVEKWLRAAIERKPDSYQLLEQTAWFYQFFNRWQEADSLCEIMIAKKPDLFNAWSTLGVTHMGMLDYENAILYFQKSLQLEPGPGNWAWDSYGPALLNCRREKEGLEACKAQGLNLAGYYFSKNHFDEAMPYILELRKKNTNPFIVAGSYQLEGAICLRQGKFADAKILLEKSLTEDPTPDGTECVGRVWLAILEAKLGHFAQADSLFRDAFNFPGLGLTWGHEEAHVRYGDFLLEQNRLAEAQIQYEKTIEMVPRGNTGYFGLARLAAKKGDKIAALDWLEKALDRWYPRPEPILEESLFKKIKKTKRFKALMLKHFPPGWEER